MAFPYASTTAQEILEKPIDIKNVVIGLKSLRDNQIITTGTAANCINLIFQDITTDAGLLIQEMEKVEQGVRAYSNYLYKTTDELTREMSANIANTDLVDGIRLELDSVFDDMTAGFDVAIDVLRKVQDIKADFYSGHPSTFWVGWENYDDPTVFTHTHATMADVISSVLSGNTKHFEMKTKIANLMNQYPNISIEQDGGPGQILARKLNPLVSSWYFVASGSVLNPVMRLHPDDGSMSNYNPDISYALNTEGIILSKANSYSFRFIDETPGSSLQLLLTDPSSSTIATLSHNNVQTVTSSDNLRNSTISGKNLATAADGIDGFNVFIWN